MVNSQMTTRDFLLTDAGLAAVFEAIDDLHSAASEGQINLVTPVNRRELVNWLQELIFTAQEAIEEIEAESAATARQEPYLRLVK
jgi:hypothetical protein